MPFRSGFVALIGRPNVGKSTILNTLVGQVVAIAAPKPQTTRGRIRGIVNKPDCQIVFIDTPGLHFRNQALDKYLLGEAQAAAKEVDLVIMVVEAGRHEKQILHDPEDQLALDTVRKSKRTALLAINKIDKLRDKKILLPFLQEYARLGLFAEIIPISAKTGDGLPQLQKAIVDRLPEGPQFYPPEQVTDQTERALAAEFVREQIILQLGDELPYNTAVVTDSFEELPDRNLTSIHATIFVERDSQKGILIGKGGQRLKSIGVKARASIENMLQTRVYLELHVKVSDSWTKSNLGLKKAGYQNK